MGRAPLFLAMFVLASAHPAIAQETTGSIRGRVLDAEGRGLPAVGVSAAGPHLQGVRRVETDDEGRFRLLGLPDGRYVLTFERLGLRSVVMRDVLVHIGGVTGLLPVVAEVQQLAIEPIVIVASQMTIDPVQTSIGARLTTRDYRGLPGQRDYTSIVSILPHANESARGDPVNVGGASGLENAYYIDGVNVTHPLFGNSGTRLPYNFVRAVEMKTGGYEAQYGRALGAIMNAVTYSGTNDFEVQFFGYGTSNELSATPLSQPTMRETGGYSYDVGGRVSGPIRLDRLWYSLAWNPSLEHVDREIVGHGRFDDRRTTHKFAGKLSWHPTPPLDLELSVFGDPMTHHAVQPAPFLPAAAPVNPNVSLVRIEEGGITTALRAGLRLNERLRFDGTVSRADAVTSRGPATPGVENVLVFDLLESTVDGQPFALHSDMARTAAALQGTASLGRHTVVAGVEYEEVVVDRTIPPDAGIILRTGESEYQQIREGASGVFRNRIPTAYLQDSWRPFDRLTLNAGIRWSSQIVGGASGEVSQRFADEWQPRVGFVWQPGEPGVQRVFGSAGRFYQQLPVNISSIWNLDYPFIIEYYTEDPRQPGATPYRVEDYTTFEEDYRDIPNLSAESSDEFTLGYERLLGADVRATARVLHRRLRSAFGQGFDTRPGREGWVLGRLGAGDLDFMPTPRREYTALELSAEGELASTSLRVSYVLSRNRGNYPGLHQADIAQPLPNPGQNLSLLTPEQAANSFGLLPNDRTHVLKLSAMRAWTFGVSVGAILSVASGNPMNVLAAGAVLPAAQVYLMPRGSAGRTPALWDLGVRFAYDSPWSGPMRSRVVLDVLHVGNPQAPTRLDELLYAGPGRGWDNQNPNFRAPLAYQPPMRMRVGLELGF